jgi:SAM-dependent methyltransferase
VIRVWMNPHWSPDADEALYEDAGIYAKRNYTQARNVRQSLAELSEPIPANGWILDYGCGDGTLIEYLKAEALIFDEMLDIEGYDPITRPDASNLEPCKYAMVFCVHVIEHVDQPLEALAQLWNVLKPGGRLVMVAHNVIGRPNARADRPWHKHLFGRNLVALIEATMSFKVTKRLTWGGFPAPRSRWQDLANKLGKRLGLGDVQMIIAVKP